MQPKTNKTGSVAAHAHAPAQPSENTLPAHRALEFCGVEDETARLQQRRSASHPIMLPSIISVMASGAMTSAIRSSSTGALQRASPTKAVLEWQAGRERRALVASNPYRSEVISAYFHQELSSLSKQAAAQEKHALL
jgi:hypothetical protein